MKAVKVALAVLLACGVTVSLAACEHFDNLGPIAIKRSGPHMLIAVCTDIRVVEIYADSGSNGWLPRSKTFLAGKGVADIKSGDVFVTGQAWPGLTLTTNSDPDMRAGNGLTIILSSQDPKKPIFVTLDLEGDGLSSRQWLHPDGSYTKKPCAGVVSTPTASLTQG